jgi:hypothetical protein
VFAKAVVFCSFVFLKPMSFFQHANHLEISGSTFYAAQRDVIFHYYPSTGSIHGDTLPREVDTWVANFLLQSLRLSLEWGTLFVFHRLTFFDMTAFP